MKKIKTAILILLATALPAHAGEVTSPDGRQKAEVGLDSRGSLNFCIISCGDTLVTPSALGIETLEPDWTFRNGLRLADGGSRQIDEAYTLPTGKRSHYVNRANEKRFTVTNSHGHHLTVTVRAYDDGVALRYELDNDIPVTVTQELTTLRMPKGAHLWMMDWTPNYENYYEERLADTIHAGQEYLFPALVREGGRYMLVTEASVHDLPAMHLRRGDDSFSWAYAREDKSFATGPAFASSWKTFITGSSLADIVESSIVENLNPPSVSDDFSWIHPGVAAFPWWGDYLANSNIDTMKKYVDLAAEMHWGWLEFDVSLIDSPLRSSRKWRTVTWIPELTAYARKKGIRVYGWDEIAVLDDPDECRYVFDAYQRMGIDGIKIDYIDSDSRHAMRFRDSVSHYALKRKMLVSFHGETLPRGQRRTYPNIMTNEGVKGAEYYTFRGAPCANSWHNCMLPFTRNVVGPMDYTPVTFTVRPENPRTTTYAHELALPFVFESGWTCMADKPEAYLDSPAKDLLQKIETAWDDIHFVDGRPGEYFCVARRKGGKWFIAGINGKAPRTVSIPLGFLGKGRYDIVVYEDDKSGKDSVVRRTLHNLTPAKAIRVNVKANGGFVMEVKSKQTTTRHNK